MYIHCGSLSCPPRCDNKHYIYLNVVEKHAASAGLYLVMQIGKYAIISPDFMQILEKFHGHMTSGYYRWPQQGCASVRCDPRCHGCPLRPAVPWLYVASRGVIVIRCGVQGLGSRHQILFVCAEEIIPIPPPPPFSARDNNTLRRRA